MKNFIENNKFLNAVYCAFFIIFIYLFSGSPYQTIFNLYLPMLAVGFCTFFLIILRFRKDKKITHFSLFFGLILIMVALTVISHFEIFKQFYFRFLAVIFVAFYISQNFSFKKIRKFYVNSMFAIALVSLVGYFLANNTNLLNFFPEYANGNDKLYSIGIIFNYMTVIPERNCGIFWEPGIYATYLIIAIVFEILVPSEKFHRSKLIIFVITTFTSTSSAGLLLLVFCLFVYIFKRFNFSKMGIVSKVFSIGIFVTLVYMMYNLDNIILNSPLRNNQYIIKLLSSNMEESSRYTVIEYNLKLFFDNFLFGAGISNVSNNTIENYDISTITYILSVFGFMGLVLPLGFIIGFFKQKKLNNYIKFILVIIVFSILSKEPHLEMIATWILFFSLLKNNDLFVI